MRKLVVGRKRVSIALGLILMVALAGGAFAYWTAGGSGTGSAGAGTTLAVIVNQTGPAITGLYPGEAPVTLHGNFDNPNPGPVFVTSVMAAVHPFSSQADGSKPACTDGDFAIAGSAPVGHEIAAGNGVDAWSGLTIQLVDGASNQDNCKGVIVQIDYTAN